MKVKDAANLPTSKPLGGLGLNVAVAGVFVTMSAPFDDGGSAKSTPGGDGEGIRGGLRDAVEYVPAFWGVVIAEYPMITTLPAPPVQFTVRPLGAGHGNDGIHVGPGEGRRKGQGGRERSTSAPPAPVRV